RWPIPMIFDGGLAPRWRVPSVERDLPPIGLLLSCRTIGHVASCRFDLGALQKPLETACSALQKLKRPPLAQGAAFYFMAGPPARRRPGPWRFDGFSRGAPRASASSLS